MGKPTRAGRIITVLLATLLLAITACSGDGPSGPNTPSPAPVGPAILTVAVYGPAPVITAYTKTAATFTAEHPGTVVNIQPFDDRVTATTALLEAIEAGHPPDIFLIDKSVLHQVRELDAVTPVDRLLTERGVDFGDGIQRDALERFSADSGLQCMPVDATPMVVYYNTDLIRLQDLAEPGGRPVDQTNGWRFDAFVAAAASVRARGSKGLYLEPSIEQLAPFIWSGGGTIVDDDNEPTSLTLSDAPTEDVVAELLVLARDRRFTFGEKTLKRRKPLALFRSGRLGMILGYRDLTPILRNQENLNFDVMPMPRIGSRATVGRTSALCLSSATDHIEAAADFLAYAIGAEAMTALAATGYVTPTNLEVLNSAAFLQPEQQPAHAEVFPANIRPMRALPGVTTWPSVAEHSAELLHGLFYGATIEPLDDLLRAIDAASAPLFTPMPTAPDPETEPDTGPKPESAEE